MATNYGGGPYSDATYAKVRPEHDPVLWHEEHVRFENCNERLKGEVMTQNYYGTKALKAWPMTRGKYNTYRGWTLPDNENPEDPGYLVEYQSDGIVNHPDHRGYISWSPKDVFEAAYQPINALSFGHAIEALKVGERVARAGWNGKGMWLKLIPAEGWLLHEWMGSPEQNCPWIVMRTADDKFVPWLASQTDMLANDWCLLE